VENSQDVVKAFSISSFNRKLDTVNLDLFPCNETVVKLFFLCMGLVSVYIEPVSNWLLFVQ